MFDFKGFRKKNDLTQPEIAQILGCTQGFISKVEKGSNQLSESMIAKLIAIYGMDNVQNFIKEDEDESSPNSNNRVSGDANNFGGTYNTFSQEALEVIKEQSKQIGAFQTQIDNLLQMIVTKDELIKSLTEALLKK